MKSFTMHLPTRVIFGAGSENSVGAEAAALGRRVYVIYGGGSARKSGLLDRVCESLKAAGLAYKCRGGVVPNPRLAFARESVAEATSFGADLILAVGGGSVIDTAKAVAHGTANPDTDIWDFWQRRREVTRSLPVGVVLTISAAGSETSDSAVLTDADAGVKRGLNTPFNRPAFAIMDPALTCSLPKWQIACGVADIMMHTLGRYYSPVQGNEMTDEIAEGLLRVVMRNGRAMWLDPHDLDAASEVMWCGSLSHNGLTGLGGKIDFSVHKFGHALSAIFDVSHGASLTACWGSFARFVAPTDYARFARLGRKVLGIAEADDRAAAQKTIEGFEDYWRSLELPICFSQCEFGLQSEQTLEELSELCCLGRENLVGSFRPLNFAEVLEIYRAANR